MTTAPESEVDIGSSAMPPAGDPRDITLTIADLVADHARDRGGAIAVQDRDRTLTYAELAALAGRIGALMERAAPGQGPVGILLPASASYVAAIVAMLARGIPYVPLDESFPAARNGDIARRAGLAAVIVDAATGPLMREIAPDVQQVAMPDLLECFGAEFPVTARPDDIAVIFYTSGSTGEPKGVYQGQRSILYEVLRHCWRAGLREEDAVALLYSPSVSGSTRDIYGSLAAGARLCIVDVKRMGLGEATRTLADWRVSVLHSIPGLFRAIFAGDGEDPRRLARSVRLVHLISDRVLRSDVALYRDRFSRRCRLCIDLATTETYSYASWYLDHDTVIDGQSVPVGYPRSDIVVKLLDDRGQAVAAGGLGEFVVGGRALSLGYWRDEALTRSRFATSTSNPGMREFRTGDMGRLLPNGLIEFVGRKDRQIKLRGNTVHLAEVETIMAGCPGVAETGAVARGDAPDIKLVVYYAADPGVTADVVRDWSAAHLASSTQPTEIVRLDALPRLPSGKPDLVGLKELDAARASAAPAAGVGGAPPPIPASAAMRAVCDGWEEFLEPGAFDGDVAFGDAGGDSLKGLKLLLLLEGRLKRKLRTDLLDMRTRPSDLIDRLARPTHASAGDVHDDRPILFLFAGLYGPDISTVDFARRAEHLFSAVLVDYTWGGDDFTGTFDADRLFDEILTIAGRAGSGRSLWLLGHSYGGKIAAEASRRLLAAGMSVDFVGVVDGLPSNSSLKRYQALPPREPLVDRIRHGVARNGGLFNYISMGAAEPLGAWLASRRHYWLLGWTLWMARLPGLAEAGFKMRRSVMATVRLAAFAPMPLGPIATGLRLFLSTQRRFEPALYPTLGWESYFDSIETTQMNVEHLDFFKEAYSGALIETLGQILAASRPDANRSNPAIEIRFADPLDVVTPAGAA